MQNYVREYEVGGLLRATARIFGQNFVPIALAYALLAIPAAILQQEAQAAGNVPLLIVAVFVSLLFGLVAFGAITIVVSDVCLGERPSVVRAYRTILGGMAWRVLRTNLLQILVFVGGLLLLVVPGLILFIQMMFAPIVAILEGRSGIAALKRSRALTKGYAWRNAGVVVLMIIVQAVLGGVIGGVAGGVGALFLEDPVNHWAFRTITTTVLLAIGQPLIFIAIALMYYDLRARKEAYDVRALAEDLRR